MLTIVSMRGALDGLVVESQEVVHTGDAAHGRLVVECGVWTRPVVAVNEGLQGSLALG